MQWCFGIILMVCQSAEAPKAPLDTYCRIAKPVRPSIRDTEETKIQAAREFAKWKENCQNKGVGR